MTRSAAVCAVVFTSLLLAHPGHLGAQDTRDELRVARLVTDLGSDQYAVRETADEELAKLGPIARKQLLEAAGSDDAEVRLRAKDLLEQIAVHELWQASTVSVPEGSHKSSDLFVAMAAQSANHITVGDQFGVANEAEISAGALAAAPRQFWPLVDAICRESGNHFRPHYDNRKPGVVVLGGDMGSEPIAYSGPVRCRMTSARRAFTEDVDYQTGGSETTHSFRLNLEMLWEDRFRIVAYRSQPDVIEAVTARGTKLLAAQSTGQGWNIASPTTRQLAMHVRLEPPSPADATLDTLRLAWELVAVGEMTTLEVRDLTPGVPQFQDDVELVIDELKRNGTSQYELSVQLMRGLVIPEPEEVLTHEYELSLVDTKGREFRKQGEHRSLVGHNVRHRTTFVGVDDSSEPAVVRLEYPKIRSRRALEITFQGVPLPVGKPE
jgi:hypothetical protein